MVEMDGRLLVLGFALVRNHRNLDHQNKGNGRKGVQDPISLFSETEFLKRICFKRVKNFYSYFSLKSIRHIPETSMSEVRIDFWIGLSQQSHLVQFLERRR